MSIDEMLAEIRNIEVKVAVQGAEMKWVKWLLIASLSSSLGTSITVAATKVGLL